MVTLTNKTNKKTLWILGGTLSLGICLVCLFFTVVIGKSFMSSNRIQNSTNIIIPTKVFINGELEQMVDVPAGEFEMGTTETWIKELLKANPDWGREIFIDGLPHHTVYLDKYSIDKFEVTNEMFAQFVSTTKYQTDAEKDGWGEVFTADKWIKTDGANWEHPRGPQSSIDGNEKYPVVQVSWQDANSYCHWTGGRLPTEAEWEKAAKGTDDRLYPWGNNILSGDVVNFADENTTFSYTDTTIDDGYRYIAPVGSYPKGASPYGVMDMAGNVYEWVADWYSPTYYSVSPGKNPVGPSTGKLRVKRGGAWLSRAAAVMVAYRDAFDPNYKGEDFGFRCVR